LRHQHLAEFHASSPELGARQGHVGIQRRHLSRAVAACPKAAGQRQQHPLPGLSKRSTARAPHPALSFCSVNFWECGPREWRAKSSNLAGGQTGGRWRRHMPGRSVIAKLVTTDIDRRNDRLPGQPPGPIGACRHHRRPVAAPFAEHAGRDQAPRGRPRRDGGLEGLQRRLPGPAQRAPPAPEPPLMTTAPAEPSCSVGIGPPSGRAAHVAGSTIPSTVNPAPCWNCLTVVSSFGPKTSSTVSPGIERSPQRALQSLHRIAGGA
jgi:hypothetical protein